MWTSLATLLRGNRLNLTAATTFAVIAACLALSQPLLAGHIVDTATDGRSVSTTAGLLATAFIGQIVVEALSRYLLERLGERVVLEQRKLYASHIIGLPIDRLDGRRAGELVSRGAADTALLRELPRSANDLVVSALTLACGVALMLTIDPMVVCIVVPVVGSAFFAANRILMQVQTAAELRQSAVGEYAARLDRALGAIRTVKLFGAEKQNSAAVSEAAGTAYALGLRTARLTALAAPIIRLAATGSFLLVLVLGGSRVASGDITIGQLITLFLYTMYSVVPLSNLFEALIVARTGAGAYRALADTLQLSAESEAAPKQRPAATVHSNADADPGQAPLIKADHLSFAYNETQVLNDVSFEIRHNQITALVGASGAGKSTLMSLLCKFHEPTTGTLYLRGTNYRDMDLRQLRQNFALVEQDTPALFGSIRDNLEMAAPGCSEDKLWAALEQASLAETVRQMPAGLDTAILDRGRALSGGQRQRLAVARALLAPAELILMDEPTSSLDRSNEHAVMSRLTNCRGRRSVLVIAHHLSTVAQADHIIVLDEGRIVAQGRHQHLLNASPTYRQLVDHHIAN